MPDLQEAKTEAILNDDYIEKRLWVDVFMTVFATSKMAYQAASDADTAVDRFRKQFLNEE